MVGNRQKRLDKAQVKVLFRVPFFAGAVASLPVIWDETTPTAHTDGKEIRWNPEWFDQLAAENDGIHSTILCEESCHCLLGHLWRAPVGCDWDLWNQACDHEVRWMMREFSEQSTSKGLADPFPFPKSGKFDPSPEFRGVCAEQVYATLAGRKQNPRGQGPSGGGQGGKQGGKTVQSSPGGIKTPGKGVSAPTMGNDEMSDFGQMHKPKAPGPGQPSAQKLKNDWEGRLVQAVQMAKGRGNVPAGLERLVDGLLNPSVPWFELLRSFLRELAADDWNWLKPDPAFDESGFILPRLESEKIGGVVFATDTSGSINKELLARFQTEKQACLDELRPHSLVDIYCDSKIHKVAEYRAGDTVSKDAPGGGGTCFEPVFEHIDSLPERPKCVVYLTDLDGSFPDKAPEYPVLWVTWTKDGKAPFGEVVYAPTEV